MAREQRTRRSNSGDQPGPAADVQRNLVGVMSGAQEAAERLRSSAAEHLPEAMAGAEVAARETQKVLGEMPNQALIVGTSFSLGLGVGLFLTGTNRLLVLLAISPAIAMAVTLMSREKTESAAVTSG